ncbi:hypothetical protein ACEPAH_2778 [Sanghuangporus vaninii]
MLLRLVPEQPHPTILFTLAFNNLPDGLPFPAAWTAQLQQILHDELEMPQCIHALDKAAWATCLLHEVTFSMPARRVSAMFVDGTNAEWPLEDEKLNASLKKVMDDVSESSVAAEMEQRRAQAIQAAAQAQAAQERMPPTPTPMPVRGKHKKSRSLLMSLVASICPSVAPSPLPLSPPRPISSLELAPPPPEPPVSSRHLRRKARADLVDIYRRYILPALAAESVYSVNRTGIEGGSGGGYVLWNLQSILRRIEVRMCDVGAQLGSPCASRSSSVKSSNSKTKARRYRVTASVPSETPFDEEEESSSGTGEGSVESGDTEASSVSVQTPKDVLPEYPLMCTGSAQEEDNVRVRKEGGIALPVARLSSSPTPQCSSLPQARVRSNRPKKRFSQPAMWGRADSPQQRVQQHEYAILHASTIRLRALITRTSQFVQAQAEERSAVLVQLEARSRRRAWSCRQLLGGARTDVGIKEGLSAPLRSSALRWSWTVTTLEAEGSTGQIQLHGRLQGLGRPRGPMVVHSGPQEDLPAPMFFVPSQGNSVPFPQREPGSGEGDDFCCTGPQDTSTLFGAGEGDDEDSPETASETPQEQLAPFARSTSSDDLPTLFSSLSTPTSSSVTTPSTSPSPPSDLKCNFEIAAFEDADTEMEEMELGRLSGSSPGFDSRPFNMGEVGLSCGEFGVPSLGFEKPSLSAPIPVPDHRNKLGGETMDEMGMPMPMERGMGARLYARRRAALMR